MTFHHSFELPHHNGHSPPDLDRKPVSFDLLDDLDPLDSSLLESGMISPSSADRRDSFATSTPFFSPQSTTTPWDDPFPSSATTTTLPERHLSITSHFGEHSMSNNPFYNHNQQSGWLDLDRTADSRTPVAPATYVPFTAGYDAQPASFPQSMSTAPPFGALPGLNNVRPAAIMPPAAGATPLPTSPPPGKEWMALAEQDNVDARRLPKRIRQNSPPRSLSPGFSRQGVRKKNARFEIPPERSLANIDQLINQCDNEDDIKELKQQKRLLRNRQAALDSRHRKKKHTEDLEDEKKLFTEHKVMLESEMKELRIQLENFRIEKEEYARQNMHLSRQVEELTWDKENLVEQNTLETGELRKKISIFKEMLDAGPTLLPSHSNEFNEFTDELDGLNMGSVPDWDNYNTWVNDISMESEQQQPEPKLQVPETAVVLAQRRKEPFVADENDKPIASGLLLMLLLYGAFVVTRSSGSPVIPRTTDEVRAASATILDNLLRDAGSTTPQKPDMQVSRAISGLEPAPSLASWVQPDDDKQQPLSSVFSSSNGNPSTLDSLSAQLMAPSKEQEAEAAFRLTPAQYNSLTSTEYTRPVYSVASTDDDDGLTPPSSASGGRKNLADTLRIMREDARGNTAAEVYTRSLLWDRIPTEVVHEFKRMVEESASNGKSGDTGD